MLRRIKLTNFRQHRDLSIDFGAGLSVIRGSNEAGKSTVIEAVSYAMFGVKAIRDSLADCVTWGEKDNTLKVELAFDVDGVTYNVSRGKSGAELRYDGGSVTGQIEVTAFVARLLKMDASAAARLVMSNQGAIRGALEAGTKATTDLIERLAEFDQIDQLIELMQERLSLGSPATIEANLGAARATLERAEESLAGVAAVDEPAHATRMQVLNDAVVASTSAVASAQSALEQAEAAQGAAQQRIAARRALDARATDAQAQVDRLERQLERIEVPADPGDVQPRVQALQVELEQAKVFAALLANYGAAKPYYEVPAGERVKMTREELQDAIYKNNARQLAIREEMIRYEGQLKLLNEKLLQGTCTFCGKDFSGVPEVAQRNQTITTEIGVINLAVSDLQCESVDLAEQFSQLNQIQRTSNHAWRALETLDNLELADDLLPSYLKWVGPDVSVAPRAPADITSDIQALVAAATSYRDAATRRQTVLESLEPARTALADALSILAASGEETSDTAEREAVARARRALDLAKDERTGARATVERAEAAFVEAQRAVERARADLDGARHAIERFQAQLKELEFNNALLKRVRQVRPLIADKLWAIVLTAVSAYFSEIRGERSKVTKSGDGFEVDGHAITSLSGSTLDALGLAIRVALVRTFLPTAPFLALDEPCAAMDDGRTDNTLGFIATTGYQQVILVTHEDVSQTIADHLITLGEPA